MLETSTILWSITAPAVLVIIAITAGSFWGDKSPRLQRACMAMGWWIAIHLALIAGDQWNWPIPTFETEASGDPVEAWRFGTWGLLAMTVASWLVLSPKNETDTHSSSVAFSVIALLTLLIITPTGDNWEDTTALHRVWIPITAIAFITNCLGVMSLVKKGASRWCLWVALAGLCGPLAMALATYASLSHWCIAILVATALFAVAASFTSKVSPAVIHPPSMLAAVIIVYVARHYSYIDYPVWTNALALFLPTMVATVDIPLRSKKTPVRVAVAFVIAAIASGLSVWQVLLRETETW